MGCGGRHVEFHLNVHFEIGMFLKFDVSKRYLENAHFHQIMVLLSYVHPRPCCTCVWRRCTHDVRKIFGCLNPPYPLSINQTFPLSLVNPLPLRTSYAHGMTPCLPQRRWTGRSSMAHKAKDRMEGEGTGREGGRRQTAEGFSILKPFFPIAAASKLREEKRSVRMGSLNFPAYP